MVSFFCSLDFREDGTYTTSWQKEIAARIGDTVWKAEMKFKDGIGNNEINLTLSTGQPTSIKEETLSWESTQMLSNADQERRPKLSASVSRLQLLPASIVNVLTQPNKSGWFPLISQFIVARSPILCSRDQ